MPSLPDVEKKPVILIGESSGRSAHFSNAESEKVDRPTSRAYSTSPRRLRLPARRIALHVRRSCRLIRYVLPVALIALAILMTFTYFFNPSYTRLPPHYQTLRNLALQSRSAGRGNPRNERIFISVSLYDKGGHLAGGMWGQKMLDLIDLLGPGNTFLSIYENDSGPEAATALRAMEARLPCPSSIVIEQVDKNQFPNVTMPNNTQRLKRLAYLAEMRNRSLRPLDRPSNVTYDKILFFNDIAFDPIDALQLLFSTNQGTDGKAHYTAACGLDFWNPLQLYDVYATRDMEGYSMGVEIFPYFSTAGKAQSRRDVLDQKDAVRVKSCWSGMAAFDAKYFQTTEEHPILPSAAVGAHVIQPSRPLAISGPVRWRYEPEIFWDACECCLLMADTLLLSKPLRPDLDTGIYMNPYVRVAYGYTALWWLKHVRRVERVFAAAQWLGNHLRRMPTWNPHRAVNEGQFFREEVWKNDGSFALGGSWHVETRIARNGMYCGVREMQLLLQSDRVRDKNWENARIPGGRQLF